MPNKMIKLPTFSNISASSLGCLSVAGYIFFSVLPYATAGRYLFSALMLLALIVNALRGQLNWPSVSWMNLSLLALIGVTIISALNASDPSASFSLIRKDALPFVVAYLLLTTAAINRAQQYQCIRLNMVAILVAFAFRTAMAVFVDVKTGFQYSLFRDGLDLPRYLDFYAADSLYFAPLVLATLLFADAGKLLRSVLAILFSLMVFEVVVSGVRTSLVLVLLSTLILLAVKFWRLRKQIGFIFITLVVVVYAAKSHVTNPTLARYYTLIDPKTYRFGEDFSVSERTAIASGVMQIAERRPWLGYGPGWKKLPTVAEQLGLLQQWRESDKPLDQMKYNYFSFGEGRVNPHNFYLALFFELGVGGVLSYISLLLATAAAALKVLMRPPGPTGKVVALTAICYVLVYIMAGFAGGPWLPALLLVFSSSLALMQQKGRER